MLKLLEKPQPPPQPVSVPARLEYKYERLVNIAREVAGLAVAHYNSLPDKLKHFPLEIDWDKCLMCDLQGIVHVLTVRSPKDGNKLVGYCINTVNHPFMHAGQKWAYLEAIYLSEEYREGWAGYLMFQKNLKGMKMLGCSAMKIFCPVNTFEKIVEHLGYEPLEMGYVKIL